MKAFLLHSVAANGGDELLCQVLKKGLKEFAGIDLLAASTNNVLSYPFIPVPNKFLNQTILGKSVSKNKYICNLLRYSSRFSLPLYVQLLSVFDKDYRSFCKILPDIDIVVLCPGGFLHEYYNLSYMCNLVEKFYDLNKRIVIFGQSIGPFNSMEGKDYAKRIFNITEKIYLREYYSAQHIKNLDPALVDKVEVSTDIAFLYNRLTSTAIKSEKEIPSRRILLNFRKWSDHNISEEDVINKGVLITNYLFNKGFQLEFLSTCQGVKGYKDDSEVSAIILEKARILNPDINAVIHNTRYTIQEYLDVLEGAAYYIGMRMHAAILPILKNIPVLNIGYEPKSKGVFETIGLEEFVCSITDSSDDILFKIEHLLNADYECLKTRFLKGLQVGEKISANTFFSLKNFIVGK